MNSWQATFDDLGRPLAQTTFVVLDLETSGGSPKLGAGITEIGAVKIRGGEVLGTFQTFINPGTPIPPFITVLTGITDAMVIAAPKIAEAFPTLLEFLGSESETVFVAHNAPFDLGFLKAAALAHGYPWPKFPVLDTAKLARQVLTKDEVLNCKLGTLAKFFSATTSPTHRALDDAAATVDVLHGLISRLGNLGITTLEELQNYSAQITPAQRAKKHLSANIPNSAGVYIFRASDGSALYVGTSRNLRSRVRSYFTAAETRRRMRDMIALTDRIDVVVCPTIIEAKVRELRLIQSQKPKFNRRSTKQESAVWVKLTDENFPRLMAVRGAKTLSDERGWFGPFHDLAQAVLAIDAVHTVLPIRQCKPKITNRSITTASSCALLDMGKCGAPCIGLQDSKSYLTITTKALEFFAADASTVITTHENLMSQLAYAERFEDATEVRNRLSAFIRGTARAQRISALTKVPQIITALKFLDSNRWEFVVIRYGRLAGSALSAPGVALAQTIESLTLTAEVVNPDESILPASTHEEIEILLSYLDSPGLRLVEVVGEWKLPTFGSAKARAALADLRKSYESDNRWLAATQFDNN
jgi:DNA polymerase-3 subunit epsilon